MTARSLELRPYATLDDTPERTKQSFKEECNINNIMARYQRTGIVDHVAKHGGSYQDCSAITFTESMQTVARATSMFQELPSAARKRFHNSPLEFLEYLDGDPSHAEMHDLGLTLDGPPEPPPPDPDREKPNSKPSDDNQPDQSPP